MLLTKSTLCLMWQRLHCMPRRIKSAAYSKVGWRLQRTGGMVCKVSVPNVSDEGRFMWRCSNHGGVCVSLSSLCVNANGPNIKWHIGPCSAHLQPMTRALCLLLSRASDDQGCHRGLAAEGDKMSTHVLSQSTSPITPTPPISTLFRFNLSSMGFSVIYAHGLHLWLIIHFHWRSHCDGRESCSLL